jgi:FkbM family methyltransferase
MKQLLGKALRLSTQFSLGARLFETQLHYRIMRSARWGLYHEPDFEFFSRFAGKAKTFIDVGANIGQSIVSFKTAAPDCTIHSFEPNPAAYSIAEKIARGFHNVHAKQIGLGETNCTIDLHIPNYGRMRFPQLASTHDRDLNDVAEWLRAFGFTYLTAGKLTSEKETVSIIPLDSLGLAPDVVKIDVEDGEVAVIKGAWETIKAYKPILLIENGARAEVLDLLGPLSYKPYFYEKSSKTLCGGAGSPNTFLVVD